MWRVLPQQVPLTLSPLLLLRVYTFKTYLLLILPVFAVLIPHVILLERVLCLHGSIQIFHGRSYY